MQDAAETSCGSDDSEDVCTGAFFQDLAVKRDKSDDSERLSTAASFPDTVGTYDESGDSEDLSTAASFQELTETNDEYDDSYPNDEYDDSFLNDEYDDSAYIQDVAETSDEYDDSEELSTASSFQELMETNDETDVLGQASAYPYSRVPRVGHSLPSMYGPSSMHGPVARAPPRDPLPSRMPYRGAVSRAANPVVAPRMARAIHQAERDSRDIARNAGRIQRDQADLMRKLRGLEREVRTGFTPAARQYPVDHGLRAARRQEGNDYQAMMHRRAGARDRDLAAATRDARALMREPGVRGRWQ